MIRFLLLLTGLLLNISSLQAQNPGDLDLSFNSEGLNYGDGANSTVRTTALQPDGKILIGGDFTSYQGVPTGRIVAINSDGSLDTRYDFGTGANNNVQKIIQEKDGKLLAIGSFDKFDEEKRTGSVRIFGELGEIPPRAEFDVVSTIPGKCILGLGDLDGDRDLDFSSNTFSLVEYYLNNGSGAFNFTDQQIAISAHNSSTSPWGDYDGDGDLDLFSSGYVDGTLVSRIFQNNGQDGFTDIQANLIGIRGGRSDWGDYDNDGDLDLIILGDQGSRETATTKLYRNDGNNTFNEVQVGFTPLFIGGVVWEDYDGDGDLDVFMAGTQTNDVPISILYRNDGEDVFTELSVPFEGLFEPSTDWGDYDADGDLDLFVSGRNSSWQAFNRLYRNEGGDVFTPINLNTLPQWAGMVKWGDFDNDGDLDLLSVGIDYALPYEQQFFSKVYRNQGSEVFEEVSLNLTGALLPGGGWADLDGDGDLDLAISGLSSSYQLQTKIYFNNHVENGGAANAKPTSPLNLVSTPNPAKQKIRLEWEAASDAETPVNSISYNLYIREVGSANYSKTPESLESDGWRLLPSLGNASLNTFSEWNYSEGDKGKTFEWSVQAIDGAFAGGEFAESGFFTLDNTPPTLINQFGIFDTDASRAFALADLSADDDETPADQLVFTIKSLPTEGTLSFDGAAVEIGLSFTQADIAAGKLSYQNTVNTARTDSFNFTVTDLFLNETGAETFSITLNDKTPPVAIGQAVTVILDINGLGAITPEQVNNGSTDNFTVPENLILALDRLTFGCADVGVNPSVQLTVTDENGNPSTTSVIVTVLDQTPPTVATKNITLRLGADGTAILTPGAIDRGTRDACGIASLSINVTQFTCADLGVREVILTATDVNGNTASAPAQVTIQDATAPTFSTSLPKSISVTLAEGMPYIIQDFSGFVADNCGVSSYTQSIPAGTVITTAGTYNVTINVADASGNTAKATVKIVRSAPKVKGGKANRLGLGETMIQSVPWNTSFEDMIERVEPESNLQVAWIEGDYNSLKPGLYQIKPLLTEQIRMRFEEEPLLNILVEEKPKALDIELSDNIVAKDVASGTVIGMLSTIDPADDIHTYSMDAHSDLDIQGNQLIWKGTNIPAAQMKVTVFSTDRAGQTISKEIKLSRELKPGEFFLYPNPATTETNVMLDLDQSAIVGFQVYDAIGRLVIRDEAYKEGSFTHILKLDGLAPGMYTVQLKVGNMVMTKRLIKN